MCSVPVCIGHLGMATLDVSRGGLRKSLSIHITNDDPMQPIRELVKAESITFQCIWPPLGLSHSVEGCQHWQSMSYSLRKPWSGISVESASRTAGSS